MLKKFKEDFDNMRKTLRAEATTEVAFNKLTNDEKEKRLSSLKFAVINPERAEVPEVMDTFKEQYGEKTLKAEISKIKKNYADGKLDMFKLPQDARKPKKMGGLLEDDNSRIGYAAGPSEEEVEQMETRKHLKNVLGDKTANTLLTADRGSPEFKQAFDKAVVEEGMGPDGLAFELNKLRGETPAIPKDDNRIIRAEGGSLLADDMAVAETHMMPDGTEMPGATHGEGEMMTDEAPEEDMAPDGEMEKEFLDFILDEALSPEEEEMLMSRLEQDEELAMLFDKVIDVAQEFAGSGPVEGPGSGVSDSIPARLSDGEFVFTAAAVEEIGADNLMAMMKEAEAAVAERQGLAEGGLPEEETVTMEVQEQKEPKVQIAKAAVNSTRGLLDEDEISKGIKSKMMLDLYQRHVRS
jgi:hypothetical protein